MTFPDYTKIPDYEDDYAICPNCGQLLKTKHHNDGPCSMDEYDCYCGLINRWETCRCKECKISGDGSRSNRYSLEDEVAWKFPKDYEVTATRKQNNYIRFLANQTKMYFNYIANKEVAGEVIRQLLSIHTKNQQKVIDLSRRAEVVRTFGYTSNGEDAFLKVFGETQIKVELEYKEGTGFTYNIWKRDFKLGQETEDLLLAVSTVKADIQKITEALSKVHRATKEDAANKIEADKEAFKKHCERDDIDEYEYSYDEAPDFGDLC